MNPERWKQIDEIFQSAADLTTRSRGRLLETRCKGDAELRREVESLLVADEDSEHFIGEKLGALDVFSDIADGTLPSGGVVGEYKLTRLIGTGGMGSVYLGERADGEFQQQVAVKFVRKGCDVRWAASRFRSERRILARLQHPHIARLLGGGSTQDGSPYLVMEFVDGVPLHEWLKAQKRSRHEILRMFLALCDAVAYAHRNLIVHRDIKPGNILMQADGSPKLLDFGISKPVDTGDHSTVTLFGAMTPAYASPEQIRGEFVSTSSDVYSLGTVLYESLAGRAPFHLDRATPAEVERVICQSAAPPLDGVPLDLAKIVHKAIHKEPERRYASVEHFADDLRRYLSGRPVSAQPDSLWYRTKKFVVRNRQVVVLSLVLLLLVGALVVQAADHAIRVTKTLSQSRRMAKAFIEVLPERIENRDAGMIRSEMALMYDSYAQPVIREFGDLPEVVREIARGYEKLGNELGIGSAHGAGRTAEARMYFEKAIHLLTPLYGPDKGEQKGKAILGRSHCGVGRLQQLAGEPSRDSFAKCLSILEGIVGPSPAPHVSHIWEYLMAHAQLGDVDPKHARAHYEVVVRIATAHRNHGKEASQSLVWKAHGQWRLWRLLGERGYLNGAWASLEEARGRRAKLDIDDRLLEYRLYRDLKSPQAGDLLDRLRRDFPKHLLLVSCGSGSTPSAPGEPCDFVPAGDRTRQRLQSSR